MNIEYEARVLEVNQEKLEKKLLSLGAKKVADYDYRRSIYDFSPPQLNKWIRLRTDGEKTTLTIKQVDDFTIDGTKEYEIEVSDFKETGKILNELGYYERSYQENKRTRYTLDDVEIDIDTWPYIPTYVEIEGKSVKEVENMFDKLGFEKSRITSLDVQGVYREIYKIDMVAMPELKFENELEEKYKLS